MPNNNQSQNGSRGNQPTGRRLDLPPEKLSRRSADPQPDQRASLPPERSSYAERSSRPQHQRSNLVTTRRNPLQDRLRRRPEMDEVSVSSSYTVQQMRDEQAARAREEELHPGYHWYRMDLHCHTPRSTVCYQQPETSYLQILQKAEERGVDILAITDHNTIAAYADIQREREDLERLERDGRSTPDEKHRLGEYRRIFAKILVLPGFEFSATFGFHILCIFPPSMSIRRIEYVLMSMGISEEKMLLGSPEVGATTDVLTVYRTVAEAGGICIGAHANSSNGVMMRGLNFGGQTKISFTQDPNLAALEVTDLDSADRRNSANFFNGSKPEYPRRMFCIQSSDSHRAYRDPDEKAHSLGTGDRTTEVLLPEQSFRALKEMFASNEFTRCRPSRPFTEPQIDVVRQARVLGNNLVQSFHERLPLRRQSAHHILRDLAAFANTNGGTVFLGVAPDSNTPAYGVESPVEVIETMRSEIQRNIYPLLKVTLDVRTSEGKSIVLVNVPKGAERPYAIDNSQIYIRQEGETSLAARDEIVQLVRDALTEAGATLPALTTSSQPPPRPTTQPPTTQPPTMQPVAAQQNEPLAQPLAPRLTFQERRELRERERLTRPEPTVSSQPVAPTAPTSPTVGQPLTSQPTASPPISTQRPAFNQRPASGQRAAQPASGQPASSQPVSQRPAPQQPAVSTASPAQPLVEGESTALRNARLDREERRAARAMYGAAYIPPGSSFTRPEAVAPVVPVKQPPIELALAEAMISVNEGDPQVAPAEAREEQATTGDARNRNRRSRSRRSNAPALTSELIGDGEAAVDSAGLAMPSEVASLAADLSGTMPAAEATTLAAAEQNPAAASAELPLDMSVEADGRIAPPRTGVEIVETVERDGGNTHHTMKDLRNGNLVHNVSRHSARRLWRYAITQREHDEPKLEQIEWREPFGESGGQIGIWRSTSRNGARRYDLAQRDPDSTMHIYYGVTDEGLHGPWLEFMNVAAQVEVAEADEPTLRPTLEGQLAPMEDETPGLPEPFGMVADQFASPTNEQITALFSHPFADEIEAAFNQDDALKITAEEEGSTVVASSADWVEMGALADAFERADASLAELREVAAVQPTRFATADDQPQPVVEPEATASAAAMDEEAEANLRNRRPRSGRGKQATAQETTSSETIQYPAYLATLEREQIAEPSFDQPSPAVEGGRKRVIQPVELRLTPPSEEQPAAEQPSEAGKRRRGTRGRGGRDKVSEQDGEVAAQAEAAPTQATEQPAEEQPKRSRSRSRKPAVKTSEETDEQEVLAANDEVGRNAMSVIRNDLRRGRDENPVNPDNQPILGYEDY